MPRIAIFGGTGYLASLIKDKDNLKNKRYIFFSRKKNAKNNIKNLVLKKNLNILKKFDYIIHLAGPNQNQLKSNKSLIKKKNQLTSNICDLCLNHNIKLIYISSLQVYENYGKNNISINSKINLRNPYSKSHYISEKIIIKKFLNYKRMFTILRMGNVFGFKEQVNLKEINNNLIHSLCVMALKKKNILIDNGSIQRTYIPSQIFIKVINFVIDNQYFKNSVINIYYKNLNLKEVAQIIQKRSKLLFNLKVNIIIKKFSYKKKFLIRPNQNFKFNPIKRIIYHEIDQILKFIKKYI
jgi:nucleoside-diphosphate-sugar epimerase